MNNQISFPRLPLSLIAPVLACLLCLTACRVEDAPVLQPALQSDKNPYVQLGEYESSDAYEGESEPYLMYIQPVGEKNHQFVISNFANLGIDITAYGNDNGISIHGQRLGNYNKVEYVIDHGSGIQTETALEISFLVHEGKNCLNKTIQAVFNGQ